MHIFSRNQVSEPIDEGHGEIIFELLGPNFEEKAEKHSVAYVQILPQKSSKHHYHKIEEESYYILNGKARIWIDGKPEIISAGQIVLIPRNTKHKIENIGNKTLEFLAICVPPWSPNDMFETE